MSRRVVITGLGVLTALGLDVQSNWEALAAGRSGVGPITQFDPSRLQVKIAGEVRGFDPTRYMDAKEARRRSRAAQLAAAAARQALEQAGMNTNVVDPERIGVLFGAGLGGLQAVEEAVRINDREGPRRINVFTIPMLMPNGPGGQIAIDHGFQGQNYAPGSACASGMDAVGQAFELIARDEADAMVAGGVEATITEVGMGSFDRTGAMTRGVEHVPQPFDKNRDGLVMSEGSGAVVLEELEHARARGAEILAEVVGYGATADAVHITQPAEGGSGMARAMRKALQRARLNPADVSYINAHGTATVLNDKYESMAIRSVFGPRAGGTPVSSTKSMTGHCMSATGAIETVYCVLAIRHGLIPPTINFVTPDPDCDLDVVPNRAREARVDVCVNNAFGFGGHNATTVIRAFRYR